MATKNTDNWIQIEWIGDKFDGITMMLIFVAMWRNHPLRLDKR